MNQVTQKNIETEVADVGVMNLTPVVSVLMITYNHEEFVGEAIESIVAQKADFPFELIVGEDCSTDNTRSIVLDYQRRYPDIIRVVYSSTNLGSMNNMNRTFPKARGMYIAWCEGDDFWHDPLKMQKQVEFLQTHPDYSMVASEYDWLVNAKGSWRRIENYASRRFGPIPEEDISSLLPTRMYVKTCAMMVRAELLRLHFQSSLRSPENPVGDRPLKLHMTKFGKVRCFTESMATYRRTPGSYVNSGYDSLLVKRLKKIDMDNRIAEEIGLRAQIHREVQRMNYNGLLFLAAATRNQDIFELASDWLEKNIPNYSGKSPVRIWKYLMTHPKAHRMYFATRSVIKEFMLRIGWIRQDFVQDD